MDCASLESCQVFMEQTLGTEEMLLFVVPQLGIFVIKTAQVMTPLTDLY